jgi:acid stress-induced BolA-like protein IbaG/YrbA
MGIEDEIKEKVRSHRTGRTPRAPIVDVSHNGIAISRFLQCRSQIQAEHVECEVDGDGCGGGYKVSLQVVSPAFEGVSLLKRHQMVHELFSTELASNTIHALTIKAWTPAQFEAKK